MNPFKGMSLTELKLVEASSILQILTRAFQRSRSKYRGKGKAGESKAPKLIHKTHTLRRSSGPGSYVEHDWLVSKVGAIEARRIERLGPDAIAAALKAKRIAA